MELRVIDQYESHRKHFKPHIKYIGGEEYLPAEIAYQLMNNYQESTKALTGLLQTVQENNKELSDLRDVVANTNDKFDRMNELTKILKSLP